MWTALKGKGKAREWKEMLFRPFCCPITVRSNTPFNPRIARRILIMPFSAEVLETLMILSFGVSWPLSIVRSYRSRSTRGKSILFLFCIFAGYICGICSKIIAFQTGFYEKLPLAFWFYIPNLIMVGTDICLYFRNKKIEAREGLAE